jgi:hypothetical protein
MDCPLPRPTGAAAKDITALKFAKANSAIPSSASDWTVKTVSCAVRPPPVCEGCPGTSVCATVGGVPGCYAAGVGCKTDAGVACATAQVCASTGTASVCADKFTPLDLVETSAGVGLFTSLAFNGQNAVIAYTKRTPAAVVGKAPKGELMAVAVNAQNTPGNPVVIDAVGDTGYFPDVKFEPATKGVAISYHDGTSKALKFWFNPQLQTGVKPEIVDPGNDVPGTAAFVGTDSAVVFGPSAGQVWVVYQDATGGDLKMARRGTTWTIQPSLSKTGAVGFFADGVFTDGKVYASHARIKSKLQGGAPTLSNSLLLESTTGN